jgi:hypothetical protein
MNHPEKLTANELRTDRLLMSDTLVWSEAMHSWSYNHGDQPGVTRASDLSGFAGGNEVYGDSHLVWRSAKEYNVSVMSSHGTNLPWIDGCTGNRTYH